MRYSNIHESFFDFLKDKKKKETESIINRMQNFLNNNPQFGYDAKLLLPGLCPLKKMAESIVLSEKYLKNFIKTINYDTIKLFRVNSKIWTGDLVVLMPTEKSSTKRLTKSYNPSIDSFYDYLRDMESFPKKRKYTRKTDYNYPYSYRRQYENHVSESFFSDFMSWMKGGNVNKEEINFDNAIFQTTHFLVTYPGYDYDKQNDTPGFIFLASLANAIQIPYNSLLELFKQNKFENAEIINFKMEGIEGPVVVFGKPSIDRKSQWDSWNAELQSKSEEEIEIIANVATEVEKEIKQEEVTTKKTEDASAETAPEVEIKSTSIDNKRIEKIAESTIESLFAIIKDIKKPMLDFSQKTLINILDSLSEEIKTKLLKEFITNLFTTDLDYLKSRATSKKIFNEENGQMILKTDISDMTIGVILSGLIWGDSETIKKLIEFYQSSNVTSGNEKFEIEKEIETPTVKEEETEPSVTENILRTTEFSKKVLKNLKALSSNEDNKLSNLIKDSKNDDSTILAIKDAILKFPNLSASEKGDLLNSVFIEFKKTPNTYFVTKNLEAASEIFANYLFNQMSELIINKIEENK